MGDKTPIEWTDATWNPVRGCSRISPGCGGPNHQGGCYAEKIAARFSDPGQPFHGFAERTPHGGRWTGKMALVEKALDQPLRWKRPRRIFVNSMSDLFHDGLDSWEIARVFASMAVAQQHTYQVLTKRPERMRERLSSPQFWEEVNAFAEELASERSDPHARRTDDYRAIAVDGSPDQPLPNVWLGTSVEDRARADERRPAMEALADAGWLTWVSYEPALGPVDWHGWQFIRWLVSGGESGTRSRPSHPDWHRVARDFCAVWGIAYYFKQWGQYAPSASLPIDVRLASEEATVLRDGQVREWQPDYPGARLVEPGMASMRRVGKKTAGALLDGRAHREFPR